jgi:hypothetical protein
MSKSLTFAVLGVAVLLGCCGCSSRPDDVATMQELGTTLTESIEFPPKGVSHSPYDIALASHVFARELEYVKGTPPPFSNEPALPIEEEPVFASMEEHKQRFRQLLADAFKADRRVEFNEGKYESILKQTVGGAGYTKVDETRKRWGYFDKLKNDFQ